MSGSAIAEALTVRVERAGAELLVALEGRLDAMTFAGAWEKAVGAAKGNGVKNIVVDGGKLGYCDGAGLGLFAELRKVAAVAGGELRFEHFSEELGRLVGMSLLDDASAAGLKRAPRVNFITELGRVTAVDVVGDLVQLITFVGALVAVLGWAVLHPHRIRWRDMAGVAFKAGANAIPVVCLLGFLVGIILSYQMTGPLQSYGAENLIPKIVSFSIIRELGPLITAILLAGRSGAAFAAEIGTMKVTEELSALETMGLEPVLFLVVPRVLAAVAVTPLLTMFNILMGLAGGCLVMLSLHYTFIGYVSSVRNSVSSADLIGGMIKALVFGLIVAAVGCMRGTQTKSGPGAVGDSTTCAVVAGIVLTIVADAVLGMLYYHLGY